MSVPGGTESPKRIEDALAAFQRGELARAGELFREAREQASASGDAHGVADSFIEEARMLAASFVAGQLREVHSLLDSAETLLHESPDEERSARLLHVRGYAHLRAHRPAKAITALLEASRRFRNLKDSLGEARVLDTLGVLWDRRGDQEKAALLVARALALKQRAGDRKGVAISLGNLGRIALHGGQVDEAEGFLNVDLDLASDLGDRRGEAMVRTNLAECYLAKHRIEDARHEAESAIRISRELKDTVAEGFALTALANALKESGQRDLARRTTEDAEARFHSAGLVSGVAHARLARARTLMEEGAAEPAARCAVGAARAARAGGVADVEVESLLEACRALGAAGDRRRAARFLGRARDVATRSGLDGHVARISREQRSVAASHARRGRPLHVLLELTTGGLDELRGQTGLFLVEGILGQGAFGTVLRVCLQSTGTVYALKRLHPGFERNREVEERLRREFTAVSRVRHPGVAKPHAFGREDGIPCLLLDYVETEGRYRSLQDLLDDLGRLPIALAVRLGAEIARSLEALHSAGIVHRDLKPSNILLHRDGHAVLTDYGLAYDFDENAYVPSLEFKGTLAYAAPEQCVEEAPGPTPAVDLYALGGILYHSLAGRWPHALDRTEGSYIELLRLKQSAPMGLRDLRPEVSHDLAGTVEALLAVDPRQRIASAAEVAERLERLGEKEME